jgi:hypothetical protein
MFERINGWILLRRGEIPWGAGYTCACICMQCKNSQGEDSDDRICAASMGTIVVRQSRHKSKESMARCGRGLYASLAREMDMEMLLGILRIAMLLAKSNQFFFIVSNILDQSKPSCEECKVLRVSLFPKGSKFECCERSSESTCSGPIDNVQLHTWPASTYALCDASSERCC